MERLLSDSLIADIKSMGLLNFQDWLINKGVTLPEAKNFYASLEKGLQEEALYLEDIYHGLNELEENGNKLIRLYQAKNYKFLTTNKEELIKDLKIKHGITISSEHASRVTPTKRPTFNYCFWDKDEIKMRYSEMHYEPDYDFAAGKIYQKPIIVNVIFIINCKNGLVQIRYDTPGKIHIHKNNRGFFSRTQFEEYYADKLFNLFKEVKYSTYSLNAVINSIVKNRKIPFVINKDTTTVTDGVKRALTMPSPMEDVRDNVEYKNNEKFAAAWLNEDLSGFWEASKSDDQLTKNLFMRISRKNCELRVLRGSLEKELNYAITKIREIQGAV